LKTKVETESSSAFIHWSRLLLSKVFVQVRDA
jgi:hypothetical protein